MGNLEDFSAFNTPDKKLQKRQKNSPLNRRKVLYF